VTKRKPRCGAVYASCECRKVFGHKRAHECDPDLCNGSWTTNEDGEPDEIIRFPGEGVSMMRWFNPFLFW
jgi:hypothetical protein